MSSENRNYILAEAFVDTLAKCGLKHVSICPGSRSTPIAVAFARSSSITSWAHLDERSAAYFSLGLAQSSNTPVAVVCSSGTAGANFFPAVIESYYSSTPLILITADRPPELWGWGAPQTMDQLNLYGKFPKWSVSLPVPEIRGDLLHNIRHVAVRAFHTAMSIPSGPVHINMPFREPLEPRFVADDQILLVDSDKTPDIVGQNTDTLRLKVIDPGNEPNPQTIEDLASELVVGGKGIIVCGPQRDPLLSQSVVALSNLLGYPILADPLSQLRTGKHNLENVIDNYDFFLRDESLIDELKPDIVVRFGAIPTSAALNRYLERHREAKHLLINTDAWNDPNHLQSYVIPANGRAVCDELLKFLPMSKETPWLQNWKTIRQRVAQDITVSLGATEQMFEGKVFARIAELVPPGTSLFAGNSMPIRDMDGFLPNRSKSIYCGANRGVNGIDGVLATTLGFGADSGDRIVLVIGDISFYHDLNSLLAAKRHQIDASIIVINNDGGGIFSFLPQAKYPEHFEYLLGTPHGLTFSSAATLFSLNYQSVDSWVQFDHAFSSSLNIKGTTIIEITSNREENFLLHESVVQQILAKVHEGGPKIT